MPILPAIIDKLEYLLAVDNMSLRPFRAKCGKCHRYNNFQHVATRMRPDSVGGAMPELLGAEIGFQGNDSSRFNARQYTQPIFVSAVPYNSYCLSLSSLATDLIIKWVRLKIENW